MRFRQHERQEQRGTREKASTRMTPASDPVPVIRPGSQVRLHLSIQLSDGTQVLSTFEEDPLAIRLGDGNLTPGTEELLLGMEEGADRALLAKGEDLFGPWSADKVQWLAVTAFPQGVPPAGSLMAFDLPGRTETLGLIGEIRPNQVEVDFNHPLSRRVVRLRFQILEVADSRRESEPPE